MTCTCLLVAPLVGMATLLASCAGFPDAAVAQTLGER